MKFSEFFTKKWMWIVYMLMFGTFITARTFDFFEPNQPGYLYYQIYMIMSVNLNHIPKYYVFTIASFILGYFTFIFMWFYAFEKRVFSVPFVFLICIARLVSDLMGHSYEWNMVRAFYFQSPSLAWHQGLTIVFLLLPSYLVMLAYIFQKLKKR